MLILWIILFSLVGSVGGVVIPGLYFLFRREIQSTLIHCLISYATGSLLASALLGLLPNSLEHISPFAVFSTVLIGIIFFFLLEKLIIWRHCHDMECEVHTTAGPMILIGDAFHNFVDGVIIATSFLSSIPIGIATGLSVIAHEIPQEVGDFAILLHSGYSRRKALLLNIVSNLSTIPAAILAYYTLENLHIAIPYIMGISAASFIYIALVDLAPELHHKIGIRYAIHQFLLMIAGVLTIILTLRFHIC